MAVSVTNQFYIFLFSLCAGALAGVFFDLFRAFRRLVHSGVVWVGVQDILYWLLSAVAAFFFLYRTNFGQPRWYIFCGFLLGTLFYHLLLGDRMVLLFLYLAKALLAVLRFLIKLICMPLRLLYLILHPVFVLLVERPYRFLRCFLRKKIRHACSKWQISAKKVKKRLKMY